MAARLRRRSRTSELPPPQRTRACAPQRAAELRGGDAGLAGADADVRRAAAYSSMRTSRSDVGVRNPTYVYEYGNPPSTPLSLLGARSAAQAIVLLDKAPSTRCDPRDSTGARADLGDMLTERTRILFSLILLTTYVPKTGISRLGLAHLGE